MALFLSKSIRKHWSFTRLCLEVNAGRLEVILWLNVSHVYTRISVVCTHPRSLLEFVSIFCSSILRQISRVYICLLLNPFYVLCLFRTYVIMSFYNFLGLNNTGQFTTTFCLCVAIQSLKIFR